MRIFNADGSEAKMCGNGIRCVGKYVFDKCYTDKTDLVIATGSGLRRLKLHCADGVVSSVSVEMGKAIVTPSDAGDLVDVGNPHLVVFVPDAENAPLLADGPKLSASVSGGVNVEFVSQLGKSRLRMRVWERGSGVTMACGTGACASAAAAVSRGLCRPGRTVSVILDGGTLKITVDEEGRVLMTGPAESIYEGETDL
jgi:diaminopimelate epimerase